MSLYLTFIVFVTAVLLSSCAGRPPAKIELSDKLTHELPEELREKFEIKEAAEVLNTPQPKPSPEPEAKKIKKKIKVKKAKIEPKSLAPAAFAYPWRRPEKDPLWLNEKQVYDINYFGVTAGECTLEVLPFKAIDNRKVYHVRATAVSSKMFSLFYRLNDTVESFMDFEGLFSNRFHLVLDESKQTRDSLELHDSQKSQTYFWNRTNHTEKGYKETKEYAEIQPFSQDSFSALYYLRTIPLPDGSVVNFPVVSEGKAWEATVTVVRRETVDTPLGPLPAVVVKPETRYRGVLQQSGDSFIWFTDDDRRFLVRLEAKVRIGTVSAQLKHVEHGTPPETP